MTEAPLEVTIVGDIDEATLTKQLAQTLGALPARKPADRARGDTHFLTFPATLPPSVRVTHEGPKEKALVGVVWPLFEGDPSKRREEYAINLAARVLSDELRHRVRQELGKTYTAAGADHRAPITPTRRFAGRNRRDRARRTSTRSPPRS